MSFFRLYIVVVLLFGYVCNTACKVACAEKPIVVVITSFNNSQWYKANLTSVFDQEYTNYRVIYLDDCSTDGTPVLVKKFIKAQGQQKRVTFIENKQWVSQMANHYRAVQLCDDKEIVVHVDGDDWLAHKQVLQKVNELYCKADVWCTYGQFKYWPTDQLGLAAQLSPDIISGLQYRQAPWVLAHLRTFYAWLFKKIKLQDLLFAGDFKSSAPAPDSLFMYPLVEMAGPHAHCVLDVLYIYNLKNPLSQFVLNADKQYIVDTTVRSWQKYTSLGRSQVGSISAYTNKTADLIMLSDSDPQGLAAVIKSSMHVKGIKNRLALCHIRNTRLRHDYMRVRQAFPACMFVFYDHTKGPFKHVFEDILAFRAGDYIVLATDNYTIPASFDITKSIELLEMTQAEGFYCNLSEKNSHQGLGVHVDLYHQESAWQFRYARGIWREPYSLQGVLYRKKDISKLLRFCVYQTKAELEDQLRMINNDDNKIGRKIGLFYKRIGSGAQK